MYSYLINKQPEIETYLHFIIKVCIKETCF